MNNLRNKVQLIGKLGRDPEFKKTEGGATLAKISLATKDIYKNARGEKVIETQWHNCIAWGAIAESIQVFLKKGNEIAIQGRLTHSSYKDKNGNKRLFTEVLVNEFMLLAKATS